MSAGTTRILQSRSDRVLRHMRHKLLPALILLVTPSWFAACSGSDAAQEQPTVTRPAMVTPEQINAPPAVATTASTGAPAGVKLNPPHGEPGHRCDIEVGAPLDGTPAPSATPGTGQMINVQPGANGTNITTAPVTSPSANSGRINPPHGEPGHDCAVPVGDPLP